MILPYIAGMSAWTYTSTSAHGDWYVNPTAIRLVQGRNVASLYHVFAMIHTRF